MLLLLFRCPNAHVTPMWDGWGGCKGPAPAGTVGATVLGAELAAGGQAAVSVSSPKTAPLHASAGAPCARVPMVSSICPRGWIVFWRCAAQRDPPLLSAVHLHIKLCVSPLLLFSCSAPLASKELPLINTRAN